MGAMIGAGCGLIVAVAWALGLMRPSTSACTIGVTGGAVPSRHRTVSRSSRSTIRRSVPSGDVWPLPRRNYAIAIDALEDGGAQAIAFDLLFPGDNPEDPVSDQLLTSVTASHDNVIQAMAFQRSDASMSSEMALVADSSALIPHGRPVSRQRLAVAQSVSLPFGDLLAAAHDVGHTAVLIDADGVVRRIPHYIRFGKRAYGSLAMRLLEVAARKDSTLPRLELAPEGIVMHWKGRRMQVPSDDEGATSIAFAGNRVRSRTATRCFSCCSGIATTTPRRSSGPSAASWC